MEIKEIHYYNTNIYKKEIEEKCLVENRGLNMRCRQNYD